MLKLVRFGKDKQESSNPNTRSIGEQYRLKRINMHYEIKSRSVGLFLVVLLLCLLPIELWAELHYPENYELRTHSNNEISRLTNSDPDSIWKFVGISLLLAGVLAVVGLTPIAAAIFFGWLLLVILAIMIASALWGGSIVKNWVEKKGMPVWAGVFIIIFCLLILAWGGYFLYAIWLESFWALIAAAVLFGINFLISWLGRRKSDEKEE